MARRQALAVTTNRTNLLVGETLAINGVGFAANESITLRVTHADGSIETSGAHGAFTASTDGTGAFSSSWALNEDPAGNAFLLTVSGSVTGTVPPVQFNRYATIQTDRYDYAPGDTATFTGAGFRANEIVEVLVQHTNGKNDGNGHQPFNVRAGADGSLNATWLVDPDDSEGSIFRLTAKGAESGLVATSTFTDLLITTIDDNGPDDEPGQKDLNQMAFELTGGTVLAISWNWDDTDFGNLGGNTGDACALIDTDKNGFADFSFCVVADGNPAAKISNRLYSCGDTRSDRCATPSPITVFTSTSTASVVANSDPFRDPPFNTAHSDGNDCDSTNCLTADTVANVTLQLSDVGGATVASLINVCSYPSQEPNSDPSDCVATPNSGVLTIVKTVHDVPSLFGDATTDTFTFNASEASTGGVSSWSKTFTAVGTQTVVSQVRYDATTTLDLTEVLPGSGWQLESLGARCVIQEATPTNTGTDTATGVDNLQIKSGLETICTFSNTEDLELTHARLTLVKDVQSNNGGTAATTEWTLSAAGPSNKSGAGGFSNEQVIPGTYALSETGTVTGYTNGTTFSCVKNGGAAVDSNSIVLAGGDHATCTITNTDNAPSLTLNKVVTNDNGGTAAESAWTLTADGGAAGTLSGPGAAGNSDVVSGATFKIGNYALSESGAPTGYTASAWSCVKNGGAAVEGSSITLALGDSATCTITNNDNAPSLILNKVLVKDNGGTATEGDWTLTANGGGAGTLSGPGTSGATDVSSGATFKIGTYALSESTGPTGYTASAWSCVKNGGAAVEGSSITLALGDSATCTITNNDNAPSLILNKVLVTDNGGTATEADWTLTANGGAAGTLSGPGTSGATDVSSGAGFKIGTYALSESTGPTGYTASAWSCVKNGGSAVTGSSITIALGDSVVCTITNNDNAPSLTLQKLVVNNNGGLAAASAWTLTANGGAQAGTLAGVPNASGFVASGTGFKAGTYALSEGTGPSGYAASAWSCVKNAGAAVEGSSITLGLGDSATCTITNNDIPPSLTLNKIVINDNGGTAAESAWNLTANGGAAGSLTGAGATGNTDVVSGGTFQKGTYALSESTGPFGYTASGWSCVKNGGAPATVTSIYLNIGDTATCTITNNDQPGTIVVRKIVKPTTSNSLFAFSTTGTGYTGFSLSDGTTNSQTLNAGSYSVRELVPLGWLLTGIGGSTNPSTPYDCTVTGSGGSTGVGDLETQTATVSLKNGDTVTCVFENTGAGATRTQGFWATHSQLAALAWNGGTGFGHTFGGVESISNIGDKLICGRALDADPSPGDSEVAGAFWSDIAKKSDGSKRTQLDQARMQLLQQLIAAELNAVAFGSQPSNGSFAAWETALCGTDAKAIQVAQQQAGAFNSFGDSTTFTPGTSADSKLGRQYANIAFWNVIKP